MATWPTIGRASQPNAVTTASDEAVERSRSCRQSPARRLRPRRDRRGSLQNRPQRPPGPTDRRSPGPTDRRSPPSVRAPSRTPCRRRRVAAGTSSVARPATAATGFPDSVPICVRKRSSPTLPRSNNDMMSSRPTIAASGKPPPMILPSVHRSGVTP
jgi:hypothetical protein